MGISVRAELDSRICAYCCHNYATFEVCAAHVRSRLYTIRHSIILIVATTVIGF